MHMNFIDAFLWVTVLSYYFAVFLPVKFQKNMGFWTQKIAWAAIGTVWTLCLTHTFHPFQWLILSGIYVVASLMSYAGIQDWGSKGHNLFMCTWDLALAVIFLSKF